ncbi:MAG: VOC family protein [Chloroflexota bacterium]
MLRGLTTAVYLADDLAAARAWYTAVLGLEPYFSRPEYIEFRLGDYQHEFGILDRKYSTAEPGRQPRPQPAGAIVYWHVDDIHATVERLVSLGASVLDPPRQYGEGFIGASVVDPFGNILGVMYNQHYLDMLAQTR